MNKLKELVPFINDSMEYYRFHRYNNGSKESLPKGPSCQFLARNSHEYNTGKVIFSIQCYRRFHIMSLHELFSKERKKHCWPEDVHSLDYQLIRLALKS